MEIQSGHSELSVISQVSAVEGCLLSGVPLYMHYMPDSHTDRERKRERGFVCVCGGGGVEIVWRKLYE